MHWGLVSCSPTASLRDVAALMSTEGVHCIVVTDDPSPFAVRLTATQRRVPEARARRPTAQQREVLRARIVLAAADDQQNTRIAGRLGVAVNTVSKWRKRFSQEGLSGLGIASGQAGYAIPPRP